jgi:transcriptional regulator with XRE-family HTH domain
MGREHLHSVMPMDASPRVERTAVRNICWKCKVRWWSRGAVQKCKDCGASFGARDVWRNAPFVPQRLMSAREARGMSFEDLATKVGGNPNVLRAYEAPGAPTKPTWREILILSRVLNMPLDWFSKPWNPEVDELHGMLFLCNTSTFCEGDEGCGEMAVALCDFPIAGGGTCDKPICAEHGKRVGPDRDYCLGCVQKMRPKATA